MATSIVQQEKKIEGVINGLKRKLARLAPHPGHSDRSSLLFTFNNPHIRSTARDHTTIAGQFNLSAANAVLMQAYLRDLPRRLGLERWLAYYERKLLALRNNAPAAIYTLAA